MVQVLVKVSPPAGHSERIEQDVVVGTGPAKVRVLPGSKVAVFFDGVPQDGHSFIPGQHPALKKIGPTLVIALEGQDLVELTDFYESEGIELEGGGWDFPVPKLTQVSMDLSEHNAVDASEETSHLVHLHGTSARAEVVSLVGSDAAYAPASSVSEHEAVSSSNSGTNFPVLMAGVLGLGAVTAFGVYRYLEEDKKQVAKPEPEKPEPEKPYNTVEGVFTAGPAIAGNGLEIEVYKSDGVTLLGTSKVSENGSFSVNVGSYEGPVILKTVDTSPGLDFLDEATGLPVDLAAVITAVGVVNGGGTSTRINANPITTIAAQKAGLAADGTGSVNDAQSIINMNSAVASVFDVQDLSEVPVALNNPEGKDLNSLGKALGIISGAGLLVGSQQTAINKIASEITISSGNTAFSDDGKALLLSGAYLLENKYPGLHEFPSYISNTTVYKNTADILSIDIEPVTADNIIKVSDTGSDPVVIRGKAPPGLSSFHIFLNGTTDAESRTPTVNEDGTWSYTLLPADIAALGEDGYKTISAKGTLPDGGELETKRFFVLDLVDSPPSAVILHEALEEISETTIPQRLVLSDIVVVDEDGGNNVLSLKGADADKFEIESNVLYSKSGVVLDYESTPNLEVTVQASGGTPSATRTVDYKLRLSPVNEDPVVRAPLADQVFLAGDAVVDTFVFPSDTFSDPDAGTTLTYKASLPDGGRLPQWLSFDSSFRTFSGNPPAEGVTPVRLTATDGALSVHTDFKINAVAAPSVQTFSVKDTVLPNGELVGKFGESLVFNVVFSEPVTSAGTLTAHFNVNGQDVVATATNINTATTNVVFTGASVPELGSGSEITLTSIAGAEVTGSLSHQPMPPVQPGKISQSLSSTYLVDNDVPGITSTNFLVAENKTQVGNLAAVDSSTVTWTIDGSGADDSQFSISPTGVLSFKNAKNFEAFDDKSGVAKDGIYLVKVKATDAAGHSLVKELSVTVQNVNEAPVVANPIPDQAFSVGGGSDTFTFAANAFLDPDAGDAITFTAKSSDGSPLPSWLSFNAATRTFSGDPKAFSVTHVKVTATDAQGLSVSDDFDLSVVSAPSLSTTLDGVTNLDVRSKIVLNVGESVTGKQGGTITLKDLGGPGFKGESSDHTQTIDATDTAHVKIVGSGPSTKIVIDPQFDLDFSSNYSLILSTGAFHGLTSGQDSVAFPTVNFSTVTPGEKAAGSTSAFNSPSLSKQMNEVTGTMEDGLLWYNATGDGDPTGSAMVHDLASGSYAAVTKAVTLSSTSIVFSGSGNMSFTNFGGDDLFYIDTQDNTSVDPIPILNENIFDGGVGTQNSPFTVSVSGQADKGAVAVFQLGFGVVDGTKLPADIDTDRSLDHVISTDWSRTGMILAG